jgi:microcystin-dependent protein
MGQVLPIHQYTALFSLLGTYFGGDGVQTFALPDLRGRVAVGMGTMTGGDSYPMGETGGTEAVVLTQAMVPGHTHLLNATTADGTTNVPTNTTVLAQLAIGALGHKNKGEIYATGTVDTTLTPSSISPSGGGAQHNNIQPSLGLNYCIALNGLFPSRA